MRLRFCCPMGQLCPRISEPRFPSHCSPYPQRLIPRVARKSPRSGLEASESRTSGGASEAHPEPPAMFCISWNANSMDCTATSVLAGSNVGPVHFTG